MTRDEALKKAAGDAAMINTPRNPDEARMAWADAFLSSLAASGFAVVPLIDKFKLQALENGGVDNWDWYGDAMEEAESMLAAAQEDSHE